MLDLLSEAQTGSQEPTSESSSFDSSTTAGLSFSFLLSSALHDWFRFLVIGMIVDGLRRHIRSWVYRFFGMFYVEVVSFEGDASYSSCLSSYLKGLLTFCAVYRLVKTLAYVSSIVEYVLVLSPPSARLTADR
jgi:hypothetical protein